MSSPHDRDGFDGPDDGSGWREPEHLGGGTDPDADQPNIADRRSRPRDSDHSVDPEAWKPAGWDLPAAEPQRPESQRPEPPSVPGPVPGHEQTAGEPAWMPPGAPPQEPPAPERRGLFGGRRRRDPAMERAFTYEGDVLGAQNWALQNGWTITDGTTPEDAPLQQLIASAPVRLTKDHRPGSVLRGRAGTLELVALDAVYASGRYLVPEYAITAAPLLGTVPGLRLSPARLWKHRVGGLVQIPSDNPEFEQRWQLLAAEDGPQVRRLVADPVVQQLLLGTDDGDEFWTTGSYLAAIRPDGHRPQLIEHHARLLNALVAALTAGY
jgi:hypothetical protein